MTLFPTWFREVLLKNIRKGHGNLFECNILYLTKEQHTTFTQRVKNKLPCPKLNIHSLPKISHPTVDFLWFPGYWLSTGHSASGIISVLAVRSSVIAIKRLCVAWPWWCVQDAPITLMWKNFATTVCLNQRSVRLFPLKPPCVNVWNPCHQDTGKTRWTTTTEVRE